MSTTSTVLEDFSKKLGLESLEADESGLYTLEIDGRLSVFLQQVGDEGLILFAGIGSIPDEKAPAVCRALLEANHFWLSTGGFNLSLIPGTLNVLLTARAEFEQFDGEKLFDLFDRFVAAALIWKQRLPELDENSLGAQMAAQAKRETEEQSADSVIKV